MSTSKIKLLSFDLDNTLYDNSSVIKIAEQKSKLYLESQFQKSGSIFDYQRFSDIKNMLLKGAATAPASSKYQFENLSHLRYNVNLEFCSELSNPEQVAKNALEIFLSYRSKIKVSNTMLSMLKKLQKRYRIVSVTNGNCDPLQTQLASYFCRSYSPLNGLRAKPHPEMLQKAISDFNLVKEQVLHIGDRIDADQLAAERAGCFFYLFAPFEPKTNELDVCHTLLAKLLD